jgi:hypothetical protein
MVCTEAGIVMEVNRLQLLNAKSSMWMRSFCSVIVRSCVQLENAATKILETYVGVIVFSSTAPANAYGGIGWEVQANTPVDPTVVGSAGKTVVRDPLQPWNELYHFTITEDGKVSVPVKEVQFLNAFSQTIWRLVLESNVTVVSDVQL